MRTKPYAGEKVIYHSIAQWWTGDWWHSGRFYVTNKRIIFEGDDVSRECIIYLDQTKSFRYKPGGWLLPTPTLFTTKEDNSEEKFMVENAKPGITKNLYSARETANHTKAIYCEEHLDYAQAISLWEKLGKPQEAARIRKLVAEQSAVKVDQTVVHGDYVDDRDTTYVDDRDTIIQDSVVSKSNIGAGGSSKMQELKNLTEMKKEGLIDDDDYEKMKREIIG